MQKALPVTFLLLWYLSAGNLLTPCLAGTAFEKGVRFYQNRDYRSALEMFSLEIAQGADAETIYYTALCYEQLGDLVHAREYFQLTVRNFPTSEAASMASKAL